MTDRADEIARELIGAGELIKLPNRIAAALRSYRNEGLEEAAKSFAEIGIQRLIRSLKSKEPQG